MFAPYCPRCCRRVLLGTRSIVAFAAPGGARPRVVLKCVCGSLIDPDD